MAMGMVDVCSPGSFQDTRANGDFYGAEAATGTLGPGWSSAADATASGGYAAKASAGTYPSFGNDGIGAPFIPIPGSYDLWYRVKVTNAAGATPEMWLGLWDQGGTWAASTVYKANQFGTSYSWAKVASGITPTPGHSVQLQASYVLRLRTDWYIDRAVLVPAGAYIDGDSLP